MLQRRRGFTLIELVVVIAVLGIIAGIAIPRFLDARATANGAKVVGDLRSLDSAITLYEARTGSRPALVRELVPAYVGVEPAAPTGEFKVKTMAGNEKTYPAATEAMYQIIEGRAVLDSHPVEWYLSGGAQRNDAVSVATSLHSLLNSQTGNALKEYFDVKTAAMAQMDSEAYYIEGQSYSQRVETALASMGIDDSNVSWAVRRNRAGTAIEIFVTERKITAADVAQGNKVLTKKYDVNGNVTEVKERGVVLKSTVDSRGNRSEYPTIAI